MLHAKDQEFLGPVFIAGKKKMKNFGNQKESSERFVKDSFMEIHKNLAPILPATEIAIVK